MTPVDFFQTLAIIVLAVAVIVSNIRTDDND